MLIRSLFVLILISCWLRGANAAQGGGRSTPSEPRRPPANDTRQPSERNTRRSSDSSPRRNNSRVGDAELTINSSPPGCSVYLNSQLSGETNSDGLLNLRSLVPGRYSVALRKTGYAEAQRMIQVIGGQSQVVSLSLSQLNPEPATITSGILNDRAINLPLPDYPAEASGTGASGTVRISVLVNEGGEVVSANAESGHPSLHRAAVEAAYRARFEPAFSSGRPARVAGVITYSFLSPLNVQTFRARSGRFQIEFPSTWNASPQGENYVTLAPENGIQRRGDQNEVIVGVIASYTPVRNINRTTIEQATDTVLNALLNNNRYLLETVSSRRREQINGLTAMTTMLTGRAAGGYDERAQVVVCLGNQGIAYMILVSPERDFASHEAVFRLITRSLRVTDR